MKSMLTSILRMKTESQLPSILMNFIKFFGAMKGLFTDNTKTETSKAVAEILCHHHIGNKHSEPYYQN
jgi:hypothetical protein